ncbi:hypothetical protein HUJ04_000597 [Dendroctonus ponderosae]|nr:hypothetical protein HUJ04_000597 [Dendroctonus ponderosae]
MATSTLNNVFRCLVFFIYLCGVVFGGSCREAKLCCTGRDSSCVVQKAPVNAIIEDLSDKPCYCDHACLKLGDCCVDFKDACGGAAHVLYRHYLVPQTAHKKTLLLLSTLQGILLCSTSIDILIYKSRDLEIEDIFSIVKMKWLWVDLHHFLRQMRNNAFVLLLEDVNQASVVGFRFALY